MSENRKLKVICPDCGSPYLKRPEDFDFETNFVGVSCVECGREITKVDVLKHDSEEARNRADETIRAVLKGTRWERK